MGLGYALPDLLSSDDERHSHSVQLYSEDASLVDALGDFVDAALDRGEAAVVLATPQHRRELTRELITRGVDISTATQQGRFVALDAAQTLSLVLLEGRPDPARFASCIGDVLARARMATGNPLSTVSIFGEIVGMLWTAGKFEAALQLEQLWNELSATQSFHLRCAYPIGAFTGSEHEAPFLKMCAEHSRVLPIVPISPEIGGDERFGPLTQWQQKAALEVEITSRKTVERALKHRESELVDLLENAVEGVQRTGPDQRILWANKALLRLLGYPAAEYLGRCFADFYVDPGEAGDFWTRLMHREELYDFSASLRCKDGAVKDVLIHSNGLWEGDRFVHTRTFIHDVTERKQMERALQQARDELERRVAERTAELREKNEQISQQWEKLDQTNAGLRELSARLLHAQDEERRRIARDLHDGTGQSLALLCMNLSAMQREAQGLNPKLAQGLTENATIVRQVSAELRTLSYLLHPPLLDEMGLSSALHWFVDGFTERTKIRVALELPESWGRLSDDLEIAVFRVVQECLTNVHRHSGSATATIRLYEYSGNAVLEIRDQGKGIPPEKMSRISSVGVAGVGLRGIRERIKDFNGALEVTSNGDGTTIRVVIPLTPASSRLQVSAAAAG